MAVQQPHEMGELHASPPFLFGTSVLHLPLTNFLNTALCVWYSVTNLRGSIVCVWGGGGEGLEGIIGVIGEC